MHPSSSVMVSTVVAGPSSGALVSTYGREAIGGSSPSGTGSPLIMANSADALVVKKS
jgi:hypothetical protein